MLDGAARQAHEPVAPMMHDGSSPATSAGGGVLRSEAKTRAKSADGLPEGAPRRSAPESEEGQGSQQVQPAVLKLGDLGAPPSQDGQPITGVVVCCDSSCVRKHKGDGEIRCV